MKKLLVILLCLAIVTAFASCAKAGGTGNTTTAGAVTTTPASQASTQANAQTATTDNYTLGTLVTVNAETPFQLNGLRLDGNRSAEENNGKAYATEGIRSGFWLDERISFYLDTDYSNPDSEDVKVVCLPHRAFAEYEKMTFDEIKEQAAFTETFTGQEADVPCFDPYVFGEDFGEGDYDILFTYQGNIAYYLVINLTAEQG